MYLDFSRILRIRDQLLTSSKPRIALDKIPCFAFVSAIAESRPFATPIDYSAHLAPVSIRGKFRAHRCWRFSFNTIFDGSWVLDSWNWWKTFRSSWDRCSAAKKWPCASCFCRVKQRTPAYPNLESWVWFSSET